MKLNIRLTDHLVTDDTSKKSQYHLLTPTHFYDKKTSLVLEVIHFAVEVQ